MKRLSNHPVEKIEVYRFEVETAFRSSGPGKARCIEIVFVDGKFKSASVDAWVGERVEGSERDEWHLKKAIAEKIEELEAEYKAAEIRDYNAKMNRPVGEDQPVCDPDTYKTIYD